MEAILACHQALYTEWLDSVWTPEPSVNDANTYRPHSQTLISNLICSLPINILISMLATVVEEEWIAWANVPDNLIVLLFSQHIRHKCKPPCNDMYESYHMATFLTTFLLLNLLPSCFPSSCTRTPASFLHCPTLTLSLIAWVWSTLKSSDRFSFSLPLRPLQKFAEAQLQWNEQNTLGGVGKITLQVSNCLLYTHWSGFWSPKCERLFVLGGREGFK